MIDYKYDNPDDAYQEALRRIKKAKDESATELDLKKLGLTVVPPEIGQLTSLMTLYLWGNKLIAVPPEIGHLTALKELWLNNNQLTNIPPEMWELTGLRELFLGENQLMVVPSEIGQLTALKVLRLDKNLLMVIPSEIEQLTALTILYLHNNKLTVIPPEICQLTALTRLHFYNNKLTVIPPEICQLTALTRLTLSWNQLTVVAPEIEQLAELTALFLDGNQLTVLPYEITRLTKLKELWLEGNPDLLIPPEIVAQKKNAQAILDYLRQQQAEAARPLNEAKLILVGQGGVGKTSLVKRLMGQEFDEAENQTEGINIETWSLEADRPQEGIVPIAINIWDFGGQEIMHATHQFFLTERSLYLLVLDARQGEDEGRVEYWLSLIHSFAPEAPVLIVINKSDQHHLDINRRGLQQKYPAIQGFIRTSARTGQGIDYLKTEIAALLATMEHVDSPFPASWMQVKQTLTTMQAEHDYIPFTAYQQLCQDSGVTEASSQQTLIRFLHDLGIVLNFDDDRVQDTNVLNPNWITEGIYTLLNNPTLQKRHGLLPHNQLKTLLPSTTFPTANQRRFVREMMLKFELAFELPNRQQLLIPDLISKEQPAFEWNEADALQFAYQYSVLPRSILHRFMVRQHYRIDPKIRWRTGVMLHHDGFTALVKADIKAATISISIVSDSDGNRDRRQFLYSLRLEFAGIHETISGTKPQEVVPIPGHPTAPPIGYAYLEQLEKLKMDSVPHAAPNGEVLMLNVSDLLNGVSTSAMRQAGLPTRSQILADLRRAFDDTEFDDLLFDLEIDPIDIGGEATADKMRELVKYMQRRNRTADLVAAIGEKRPYLA